MRTTTLGLVFLLIGCSDPTAEGGAAPGAVSEETIWKAGTSAPETPVLGARPEPLGVVIRSLGESRHGPLRVVVEVNEDGKLHCSIHRLLVAKEGERHEIGSGSSFGEDPEANWFVYLHTTHEIYAYDGGGGLHRSSFSVEFSEGYMPTPEGIEAGEAAVAEGAPMSSSVFETLTAGSEWNPSDELRDSLPPRVIELVEGS